MSFSCVTEFFFAGSVARDAVLSGVALQCVVRDPVNSEI